MLYAKRKGPLGETWALIKHRVFIDIFYYSVLKLLILYANNEGPDQTGHINLVLHYCMCGKEIFSCCDSNV